MEGLSLPLARLALYLDLTLLAGLSAWLLAGPGQSRALFRWALPAGTVPGLAALGVLAALAATLAGLGAMMGQPVLALDAATIRAILFDYGPGRAQLLRMGFLALALLAALAPLRPALRLGGAALGAALALASLAWTGHAAASEGALGTVHRFNDALHLLAAALWIGAIAGFAATVRALGRRGDPARLAAAADELRGFARPGTWLVGIVAATGLANTVFVAGETDWRASLAGDYGRLWLAKVALFAAMLGAAGLHRWILAPRLLRAGQAALPALRAGLAAELAFAGGVLAVVAWLGLTSP